MTNNKKSFYHCSHHFGEELFPLPGECPYCGGHTHCVEIINLTPHVVVLIWGEERIVWEAAPDPARLVEERTKVFGIFSKTIYGDTKNLPRKIPNVFLIVSQMVSNANKDRNDLLIPAEIRRDENGVIIGCASFGVQ